MAATFVCGGALAAPITLTSGANFPRWSDLAAVLTPSASAGSMTVAALQAAASGALAGVTHLSLHSADPGATGANELAEFRVPVSLAYSSGAERVDGETDGATATATVTASHWGAWVVA